MRRVFGGEFDEGGGRRIEWVVVGWFSWKKSEKFICSATFLSRKKIWREEEEEGSLCWFLYRERTISLVNICEGERCLILWEAFPLHPMAWCHMWREGDIFMVRGIFSSWKRESDLSWESKIFSISIKSENKRVILRWRNKRDPNVC